MTVLVGPRFSRRSLLQRALVWSISAGLLGACAPAPQPTPTPPPAAKAETPKPAQQPKPGTRVVEIRTHDWLQSEEFYGPWWQKFEQEHPNIKVKREWFPRNEMHVKIMTLAATGQVGDVVRINLAPLVSEMRLKGVIQPLDPYIMSDKRWADYDYKQFWPAQIQTYSKEGKLWGLPVVGHPGCLQYYFNKNLIEKAGVKTPPLDGNWTHDDLITIAKATTVDIDKDGRIDQYGLQPCSGVEEGVVAILRAFGGDLYNAEGTKCLLNTPESKAAIAWFADLWHKHKVAYPLELQPNYQETFPGQKVAIVVLTSIAGAINNLVKDKFEWAIAPNPLGPTGKHATQVSSDGIAMSKITKYPEEAWEVIKSYVSKEHGLQRHFAGLGSPGSRYDVWGDPEFHKRQPKLVPIWEVLIKPGELGAWHHPANGRFFEASDAARNILQDVWLGKKKPEEGAEEAYRAVQAIMDKPPV
jgi:multiple sugar transport system substrate-binding protein